MIEMAIKRSRANVPLDRRKTELFTIPRLPTFAEREEMRAAQHMFRHFGRTNFEQAFFWEGV